MEITVKTSSSVKGSKKRSRNGKGAYAVYKKELRASKNRVARIERHLRKHPNDVQAQAALKASVGFNGRVQPKRNKPVFTTVFGAKRAEYTTALLSTMDNRITQTGRLYQQLLSQIRHHFNACQYKPEMMNDPDFIENEKRKAAEALA